MNKVIVLHARILRLSLQNLSRASALLTLILTFASGYGPWCNRKYQSYQFIYSSVSYLHTFFTEAYRNVHCLITPTCHHSHDHRETPSQHTTPRVQRFKLGHLQNALQ